MLGIKQNFQQGIERLKAFKALSWLEETVSGAGCFVNPVLLQTDAKVLLENPGIGEEVFGPSAVVVACDSREEMMIAAQNLQGQLTATVHGKISSWKITTNSLGGSNAGSAGFLWVASRLAWRFATQ